MRVRKNAIAMDEDEIAAFLEALLRLKAKWATPETEMSVYDQFAGLHGAVMGVSTPTNADEGVNFGHWNIGFLPWHRQYLREFEDALDAEVSGVTVPYWDWADDVGAANRLFTADFLSSRHWGEPRAITDGVLQFNVPSSPSFRWWPEGLLGFRVDARLQEGLGTALTRGSMEGQWPPSRAAIESLTEVNLSLDGRNPLWAFWLILEQGVQQLPQTHNAGHNFIGGHMGGVFSPNDPIFWLHHANVDRLWDAWQSKQIATGASKTYEDTWPKSQEQSPFDGRPAPQGHNISDTMWPWVGDETGYRSTTVSDEILENLPLFAHAVTVRDVLDLRSLDITYQ